MKEEEPKQVEAEEAKNVEIEEAEGSKGAKRNVDTATIGRITKEYQLEHLHQHQSE